MHRSNMKRKSSAKGANITFKCPDKVLCVVVNRTSSTCIFRFPGDKVLFCLGPLHPIRRVAICVATNKYFEMFVMCTILINSLILSMSRPIPITDYVFMAIYTAEMAIRVVASGFIRRKHSYLRDMWNVIDFLVIFLAYATLFGDFSNLSGLRTFRVLRALKTVSIIRGDTSSFEENYDPEPSGSQDFSLGINGLKQAVQALLKSMKMLLNVLTLILFCLIVIALFALQLYMGVLTNKCVRDLPTNVTNVTHDFYAAYTWNKTNWQPGRDDWKFQVCGNVSGAGTCAENYTCLGDIDGNPDYTSFDNFGWGLLMSFELLTLDYFENVYDLVMRAYGPWNMIFFVAVTFFGSFYLVNLMLAVIAMTYQEQKRQDKERKRKMLEQVEALKKNPVALAEAINNLLKPVETGEDSWMLKFSRKPYEMWYILEGAKLIALTKERLSLLNMQIRQRFQKRKLAHLRKIAKSAGRAMVEEQTEPVEIPLVEQNSTAENEASAEAGPRNCCVGPSHYTCITVEPPGSPLRHQNTNGYDMEYIKSTCSCHRDRSLQSQENNVPPASAILALSASSTTSPNGGAEQGESTDGKCCRALRIKKEKCVSFLFDYCCEWVCCTSSCWSKFQHYVDRVVSDPLFDFLIMICILINTGFLAVDHHGMSQSLAKTLDDGNKIFTAIFTAEVLLKMMAWTPKKYFQDYWNVFDCCIVFISLIEWGLEGVEGLSVLRSFRLARVTRVLKLAKSWPTMQLLLTIITNSIQDVGGLTFLLVVIIYIFSVLGMQMFGQDYKDNYLRLPGKEVPRWNFVDFHHSFMMVFRVLCGDWVKPLYDCMAVSGYGCVIMYVAALAVGNFVVLNLFVAMLLSSFASEELSSFENNTNSIQDGMKRLKEIFGLNGLFNSCRNPKKQKDDSVITVDRKNLLKYLHERTHTKLSLVSDKSEHSVQDCFPSFFMRLRCWKKFSMSKFGRYWAKFRLKTLKIVDNNIFEGFILVVILASSILLAFDDIYLDTRPTLKKVLAILDIIFAIIFLVEMLLKWVAYGFVKYFTNGWCVLDCVVVAVGLPVSLFSIALESTTKSANLSAVRSLRVFRALRPLRAISRWQGMKVVVSALLHAVPAIFNVLLVCVVFWLIFGIMGVQLFSGQFFKCLDHEGERIPATLINDKMACTGGNFTWINSKVNFDNVGAALLALFQVATFQGWIEIMHDAVDVRGVDMQPSREANPYMYIYFVVFAIFGSFFTLNLFIGAIIDNFNSLKRKYEGEGYLDIFLTSNQKKYYNTLRKLSDKKPQKIVSRPKIRWRAAIFDFALSKEMEIAVMGAIGLNMVAMAIEHYHQAEVVTHVLWVINLVFTALFTLEAIVKLIGMGNQYFRLPWNVFDFCIVVLSILGFLLEDVLKSRFLTPTLLRVVRIFRIGRVLRLIRAAKGISRLLFALLISLPALFNICILLLIVMFIFSIMGMVSFTHVHHEGMLDEIVNFETFGRSMMLLFRLTTSAGWNDILEPLMKYCDTSEPDHDGLCSGTTIPALYLVSYIMVSSLIIRNMYIAVGLEGFNQAQEQKHVGITEDDFESFYMVWQRYDPDATQFIDYTLLTDLVDELDDPLRLRKPNNIKLQTLDIPLVSGDRVHCIDVLKELTTFTYKRLWGDVENTDEFGEIMDQMEDTFKKSFPTRVNEVVVTTTARREREFRAAVLIQRAFRNHQTAKWAELLKSFTIHETSV
ncbi:sodium channel protein 1 brain-like isoform X1 [Branchiostoma lanceolatum]|uniref:sodium channel protein 1 brain-like isoform X1 n=1 Tax=Branchiostoma lanceolatum TaxID=7740 RepID=UPI0034511903